MKIDEHGGVTSVLGEVSFGGFAMSVYIFYVDGMLVDTGAPRMLEDFKPFYKETPIEFVSLTHPHEDHTGTAKWLQDELDLPVYIKKEAIPECEVEANLPLYRERIWGSRKPFSPLPFDTTIESNHHSYQLIHTPGHERNHIVLYDEERGRLFSGDLFVHPKPKVMMEDESIPVMMRSIRRVLQLDFQEMFCQHAGFIPNGKEAMREKLNYLEELSGQVHDLYNKGHNIEEINAQLFSKVPKIVYHSSNEYDSKNMIRTILEEVEI
ncbi:MBL fold metallo-hydrolase [Pontibacillus sp. ALD_SL1]|uniref:MBL fold metallo-hydrolase n=1 Tax=Pontibacillus sp. ALD_SL1 TaxID=2777185 RepID=UPI001A96FCA3|nr:MBL fold metallo-hydrolase [Pontibacillus sp. ALD_SL1]QST00337.1 MBL fold metallo-hydrolase [Pontibacillus sp. ALD_SL1]